MTEKSIDKVVRPWFVFGVHAGTGNVDVNDGEKDVFTDLPREVAVQVIAVRDSHLESLYRILKDVP